MKINYQGPVNNRTGYGIAACQVGYQLSKKNNDLSIFPIGSTTNQSPFRGWIEKNHYNVNPPSKNSPTVKIWHEPHLYEHISRPLYGWPIFELDDFSQQAKNSLKWCDYHIVCSKWAKSVLVELGINTEEKVGVVPLGVDTLTFFPVQQKEREKYVFLNVSKWEVRKGHDILPRIFNAAFSKDDNVELWMVPHNQFLTEKEVQDWARQYKTTKLADKIKFFGEQPSQNKIAELMNLADCGIFPSRAEGWGLETLEMQACGKPVIVTNYSGHTEYCTKENAYLVDLSEKELAFDGKWFKGEGQWGKITSREVDTLVDYMKFCYRNRPANPNGIETAEKFSWSNSANQLIKYLNENHPNL